jgi:hypothetical protein
VSGGFHLELEMTKEPGTKRFCSRQSITQKTTRIKAKVCWKEKVLKNGIFLKNSLSLSTKPWRQTKQSCCCKQTNNRGEINIKSGPHFQTMQLKLKQGEKIAESQEKVRDGEDVNKRERERER